jgi:hypothetical protein
MGFGASPPKTPQQAARFETPGSPEYEAAVAKGLDMSQAGRMGRAEEMGFKSIENPGDKSLRGSSAASSEWLFRIPDQQAARLKSTLARATEAHRIGQRIGSVSGREMEELIWSGKIPDWIFSNGFEPALVAGQKGRAPPKIVVGDRYGDVPTDGRSWNGREGQYEPGVSLMGTYDPKTGQFAMDTDEVSLAFLKGDRPVKRVIGVDVGAWGSDGEVTVLGATIADPSNIRSVNAAFDPKKSTSSTLLAASPFAAVGGAGLTLAGEDARNPRTVGKPKASQSARTVGKAKTN